MYKTSGPKLSDALDTTLRRPDPVLKDEWDLDGMTLPGMFSLFKGSVTGRWLLTYCMPELAQKRSTRPTDVQLCAGGKEGHPTFTDLDLLKVSPTQCNALMHA